jgi:hypothetical protein
LLLLPQTNLLRQALLSLFFPTCFMQLAIEEYDHLLAENTNRGMKSLTKDIGVALSALHVPCEQVESPPIS